MNDGLFTFILAVVVVAAIIAISYFAGYATGYRQGQIDSYNGKVYYCLVKQADQTTEWTYYPEGCKK